MGHLKVEFHCHTRYSPDSLTRITDLLSACRRAAIDRIVVTDHNTIRGALEAQDRDPERVIVGEEIMTLGGELLAAYVHEEIPPGLQPQEAIRRLREQGAFISVSHPFDRWRKGHWQLGALKAILPYLDAIEVFNARCLWPGFNRQAREFARQRGLAGTVGSDAHTSAEIGSAVMLLPSFTDAEGLRTAMDSVRYRTRLSGPWVHLASRYAAWRNKTSHIVV